MTKTTALRAYPGGQAQKDTIIAELQAHADADRLVKGQYWEEGKGCAVGCTIKSGNHAEYETRFGIPRALAHLEDGIFEGLPNEEAQKWPMRFMSAIPVGADLSLVGWKFLDRMLVRAFARIDGNSPVHKECAAALDVIACKARGESIDAYDAAHAVAAAHAADADDAAATRAATRATRAAATATRAAAAATRAPRAVAAAAVAAAADATAYADATRDAATRDAATRATRAVATRATRAVVVAADAATRAAVATRAAAYAATADAAADADVERVNQANDLCELLAAAS